VDVLVLFSPLFDLGKLSRLHIREDRDPTPLRGVWTLLQGGILQLFAARQRPLQRPALSPGRRQAKLVRLTSPVRASWATLQVASSMVCPVSSSWPPTIGLSPSVLQAFQERRRSRC
jgi:hypothetical protein